MSGASIKRYRNNTKHCVSATEPIYEISFLLSFHRLYAHDAVLNLAKGSLAENKLEKHINSLQRHAFRILFSSWMWKYDRSSNTSNEKHSISEFNLPFLNFFSSEFPSLHVALNISIWLGDYICTHFLKLSRKIYKTYLFLFGLFKHCCFGPKPRWYVPLQNCSLGTWITQNKANIIN